jgi:hypothetical protein
MVVTAMVTQSNNSTNVDEALSAFNQTSRFNHAGGENADGLAVLMGDAPGAATVDFTATAAGTGSWACISVDLAN